MVRLELVLLLQVVVPRQRKFTCLCFTATPKILLVLRILPREGTKPRMTDGTLTQEVALAVVLYRHVHLPNSSSLRK